MKQFMMYSSAVLLCILVQSCDGGLYPEDVRPDKGVKQANQLEQMLTHNTSESADAVAGTGSVMFWTSPPGSVTTPAQGFNAIDVTVTREDAEFSASGTISRAYTGNVPPTCDENTGCAVFMLPVGSYHFSTADVIGEILTGSIEVESGECIMLYIPQTTNDPSPEVITDTK